MPVSKRWFTIRDTYAVDIVEVTERPGGAT
jgi:uncharacterized protein YxjI